jgi:hypothetical protein
MNVEPVIAPFMAEISLALCDFVCVMRESVVDSAAVKIEIFAEILHAYAGALNVPAGISDAPRRIPFKFLIVELGACEPENEVSLIALVFVVFNAFTDAYCEIFLLEVIENVVFFELGSIEVDISASLISVAFFEEGGNHLDKFVDIACSRNNNIRSFYVKLFAVSEESICVELSDFHDSFVLTLCALEHFVVAGIAVGGKMSDIGDIHYTLYVKTCEAEIFFEDILHDIASEVSDVSEVINRRAAGVHTHLALKAWDEIFLFM